ncbi:hypothetical protein C8J56DRAFT_898807 [Mycena floridula]|nr:hypothetical protein C8J56DRAFT_898807 [Mycena floridula]
MNPSGFSVVGEHAYSACLPLLHHAAQLNYTYDRAVELDRQAHKFLNSVMAEKIRFSRDEYLQLVQARWAFDVSEEYERHCMEQQERQRREQSQALEGHISVRRDDPEGNYMTLDQQSGISGPPVTQQWGRDQRYQDGQRTPRQGGSPVSNINEINKLNTGQWRIETSFDNLGIRLIPSRTTGSSQSYAQNQAAFPAEFEPSTPRKTFRSWTKNKEVNIHIWNCGPAGDILGIKFDESSVQYSIHHSNINPDTNWNFTQTPRKVAWPKTPLKPV